MRSLITGGGVGSVVAQRRPAKTVLQRVDSPDDLADAVIYLAGAEFVIGTSLVVDGGRLLQSGIGERP